MEQLRQIGEALGSIKALMVFQNDIHINQRQCCFLVDILALAYETIAEEMRSNLRYEDKNSKWKVLEQPLKEIYKIFREVETYVKNCFDNKEWWAKVITLYQNKDSVEFHVHNLLCCIPVVIEAIEIAGELSSWDEDQINKRRLIWSRKYQYEWIDPNLFQWKFGKQYLVSDEICNQIDTIWKEDRWILVDKIQEKRIPKSPKHNQRLMNLFISNLEVTGSLNGMLLPSSILVGSKDYQVKRRLGSGGQYKEISWLGEAFVLRHIKGDIASVFPEVSQMLSLTHPNILQILCGFKDEEKGECLLVTELMSKNLSTHLKELNSSKKRVPFTLPVVVDIMLQIARGMEYLHSKKIYHGDLNPSNILIQLRSNSIDGFLQVKVTGFGLSQRNLNPNSNDAPLFIWHAPEILTSQEESKSDSSSAKYTEKSDVYSFSMICFELLTGKVPFEDSHLQGDKMSRNIRVGERPLFPSHCPKYLVNLIKRCWHFDPHQRPCFSSICRILRYIKRFLLLNPEQNLSLLELPIPPTDCCDIESGLLKKFSSWISNDPLPVSEIPFQMFTYRVMEKDRSILSNFRDTSESGSEGASISGDEHIATIDDAFLYIMEAKSSISHEPVKKRLSLSSRPSDTKANKNPGTIKGRPSKPPQFTRGSRSLHVKPDNHMHLLNSKVRRKTGHTSDSELSYS